MAAESANATMEVQDNQNLSSDQKSCFDTNCETENNKNDL